MGMPLKLIFCLMALYSCVVPMSLMAQQTPSEVRMQLARGKQMQTSDEQTQASDKQTQTNNASANLKQLKQETPVVLYPDKRIKFTIGVGFESRLISTYGISNDYELQFQLANIYRLGLNLSLNLIPIINLYYDDDENVDFSNSYRSTDLIIETAALLTHEFVALRVNNFELLPRLALGYHFATTYRRSDHAVNFDDDSILPTNESTGVLQVGMGFIWHTSDLLTLGFAADTSLRFGLEHFCNWTFSVRFKLGFKFLDLDQPSED